MTSIQSIQSSSEIKIGTEMIAYTQAEKNNIPDPLFGIICGYVIADEYDFKKIISVVRRIKKTTFYSFKKDLLDDLIAIKGLRQFFNNHNKIPEYISRIVHCVYNIHNVPGNYYNTTDLQLSKVLQLREEKTSDYLTPYRQLLSPDDFPTPFANLSCNIETETKSKRGQLTNPEQKIDVAYSDTYHFNEFPFRRNKIKSNAYVLDWVKDAYHPNSDPLSATKFLKNKPINSWLVYTSPQQPAILTLCKVKEDGSTIDLRIQKDIKLDEFQNFVNTHAQLAVKDEKEVRKKDSVLAIAQDAYHPNCSREKAEELLQDKPLHSWLVRNSSNKGMFALSRVEDRGIFLPCIRHYRIQIDILLEAFEKFATEHAKKAVQHKEI